MIVILLVIISLAILARNLRNEIKGCDGGCASCQGGCSLAGNGVRVLPLKEGDDHVEE